MAIKRTRTKVDDHFTIIPNDFLRDSKLTLKARGLLALIMSHRVGWNITIDTLARENIEGKSAIRSAIVELEEAGYLTRKQAHSESGTFAGYSYELTYEPSSKNRTTESPSCDYPSSDNPSSDNPSSDNRTHKNTIPQKTINSEDQTSGESATSAPPAVVEKPLPDQIAKWLYDQTQGSLTYVKTRARIKYALDHGRAPRDVANACMLLYNLGKPITNETLGQAIDGKIGRKPDFAQSNHDRMQQMARLHNNLQARNTHTGDLHELY